MTQDPNENASPGDAGQDAAAGFGGVDRSAGGLRNIEGSRWGCLLNLEREEHHRAVGVMAGGG